jgi:hypothetical protein
MQYAIADRKSGYLAQYRRQVVRQLGALARMFDVGIQSVVLVAESGAACWTDYTSIYLNEAVLPPDILRRQYLAHWLGALYHEIGHILFSPRPTSPLGKRIAAELADFPAMWRVLNIVEDSRIERALIGLYRRMEAYLTTVVLAHVLDMLQDAQSGQWQGTKPLANAWPLVCGRTWLPDTIRREARTQWVALHGEQSAARVAALIGQYQALPNPGHKQVDKAYAILRELYVFLSQPQDEPQQGNGQGDPQGGGQGDPGQPTKGHPDNVPDGCGGVMVAPKYGGSKFPPDVPDVDIPTADEADGDLGDQGGDDQDKGQATGQGDDQGDDQDGDQGTGQGDDPGDGQDAGQGTGQGDQSGDGQDGDQGAGQGDQPGDGQGDQPGDGDGDGQGKGSDKDGDSDGQGHGQTQDEAEGSGGGVSGGPSGTGRYYTGQFPDTGDDSIDSVVNAIEDAYERTLSGDQIARELDAIQDAADRALAPPKPKTTWTVPVAYVPATGKAFSRAEQLANDLRHLRAQTRAGWQFGVDDGDLNVDRYITPTTNPGDFFDEWRPQTFKDTDVHVIVILDLSGSMKNVQDALIEALHMMHVATDAAKVKFMALGYTSRFVVLIDEDTPVDESSMLNLPIGGTTEPFDALQYAFEQFSSSDTVHRLCMILSDGAWDTRKGDPLVEAMNGLGVDTVSFYLDHRLYGQNIGKLDESTLRDMARTHGHQATDFYVVQSLDVMAEMVESLVRRKLGEAVGH